jgi:hypothetical protein
MIGAFYSVPTGPTSRTRISPDKLASSDNQTGQTAGKPAIESARRWEIISNFGLYFSKEVEIKITYATNDNRERR